VLDQPYDLITNTFDTNLFTFTIPQNSATYQVLIQANTTELQYNFAPDQDIVCNLNIFSGVHEAEWPVYYDTGPDI
jgi:hypothetical protein